MARVPGPSPAGSEPGCGAAWVPGAGTSLWLSVGGGVAQLPSPPSEQPGSPPCPQHLLHLVLPEPAERRARVGTGASLDGPGRFMPQRARPAPRAWEREVGVHAPNPLLSLCTHTLRPGPKQGRQPAPRLLPGNRAQHPTQRRCVLPAPRPDLGPHDACLPAWPAVGKPGCGGGMRAGASRAPHFPSSGQPGCWPSHLGPSDPQPPRPWAKRVQEGTPPGWDSRLLAPRVRVGAPRRLQHRVWGLAGRAGRGCPGLGVGGTGRRGTILLVSAGLRSP